MAARKALSIAPKSPPSRTAVHAKAVAAFIVTAVGVVGSWSTLALADGHVSATEWVGLIVALATPFAASLGVAITTNAEPPTD